MIFWKHTGSLTSENHRKTKSQDTVPFPGQGTAPAGLKDVLRGMRIAFPDLHWRIEEQIAEADKVLSRFIRAGTHKAEFFGVPATRHQVSVGGMVIDRLENGKIKETRNLMHALGLTQQLGVFPSPGAG